MAEADPELASANWRVPADLPAFDGHFPGRPVVPGVVLLDRVLQLAQARHGGTAAGWQVAQVKFLHPCGPGDELHFVVREGPRGTLAFAVQGLGREVASGSLVPPPRP